MSLVERKGGDVSKASSKTDLVDHLLTRRFTLTVLLIAIIIGVPYQVCAQCDTLKDTSVFKVVGGSALIGAALAVILYKLFNESENSLNRRLKRIQERKLASTAKEPNRPVRIWVDGCFDLMHFGHANAFRQAKALGDILVVGVNTDADIRKYKGPPIMNDQERTIAVSACKWVDEVVPGAPYVMTDEYLQYIFDKHKIDYVVHGDDPCLLPDGTDVFASAKKAGRYKSIKRTEGVSTTEIVGRMLVMTKAHHVTHATPASESNNNNNNSSNNNNNNNNSGSNTPTNDSKDDTKEETETETETETKVTNPDQGGHGAFVRSSTFMPTGRRFIQFSNNRSPKPGQRIVYVDGIWDMFHAGHIKFLEECRKEGDFLYVGVYPDDVANRVRGSNYPIMNLHERVLSVLSCKHVDDVVFGAPWVVTRDLIVTFNIQVVCHGVVGDVDKHHIPPGLEDPYKVPREMGVLKVINSPMALKTQHIVDRILAQKIEFEKKHAKKSKSEAEYTNTKEYVAEI